MKQYLKKIRILDILLVVGVLFTIIAVGIILYVQPKTSLRVVIESPQGKWIYPIDIPRTVSIPGKIGTTIIRIENNAASIIDSPCPNKTCMTGTPIKNSGDWKACLPNSVFINIEGTNSNSDQQILLPH